MGTSVIEPLVNWGKEPMENGGKLQAGRKYLVLWNDP
jgi:hypothetical protein